MPTTTAASATPDLDAFLRRHPDDAGVLPGESDPSAAAAWLCFMCWAVPAATPTADRGR